MVLVAKDMPANAGRAGDVGSISGWEDPLEEGLATHSGIFAWRTHGQKSLQGYSPRGHRESDTTEVTWHTYY